MRTSGESFFQRKQQKEKVLISEVPDVARSGVSRSRRAIVRTLNFTGIYWRNLDFGLPLCDSMFYPYLFWEDGIKVILTKEKKNWKPFFFLYSMKQFK